MTARRRHSGTMTHRQRHWRQIRRQLVWAVMVLAIGGALVLLDRSGGFGASSTDDANRYQGQTLRVVKVVDGDTIDIAYPDGREATTRIRLWGVDTPETVKPDTPPQHFGPEATRYTVGQVLHKDVRLELVPGQTRDKYKRLLAFVYLPGGEMLNRQLVEGGFAYADPRYPHPYSADFRRLQREAMAAGRGLWGEVTREDLPYYYRDLTLPERSAEVTAR